MNVMMKQQAAAPRADALIEIRALIAWQHAQFTNLLKKVLAGSHDLNPTQAFMLLKMGDEPMSAGYVILSGVYQGTNENYNVGALVDMGYLRKKRSDHDRRRDIIGITLEGKARRRQINRTLNQVFSASSTRNLRQELAVAVPVLKHILRSVDIASLYARR